MKKQVTIIKPQTIDVERLPINKKVFRALTAEEQRDQLRKHYGPYAKDLPSETNLAEAFDVPNKHSTDSYVQRTKRRWVEMLDTLNEFKNQDELHRRFNITKPYLKESIKALAKTEKLSTNSGTWRSDAEKVLTDVEPLPFGKLVIKERGWSHDLIFEISYEEAYPIYHTVRPCIVKEKDLCDPAKYIEGWHGEWEGMSEIKEECHDVIEHYHRQVVMCLIISQTRQLLQANCGGKRVCPGIGMEHNHHVPLLKIK